jgi:hypothetical protein
MAFGPDGNLYVVSQNSGTVLRFEGPTGTNPGALLGTVVSGLSSPVGLLFGPDGHGAGKLDLYVTGYVSDGKTFDGAVLRYNWKTGAFLDTFVPPASGGLSQAFLMTFTETDPTTLNYDGATTPNTASTLLAQPAGSTRAVPTSVQPGTGTWNAALALSPAAPDTAATGGAQPPIVSPAAQPAAARGEVRPVVGRPGGATFEPIVLTTAPAVVQEALRTNGGSAHADPGGWLLPDALTDDPAQAVLG